MKLKQKEVACIVEYKKVGSKSELHMLEENEKLEVEVHLPLRRKKKPLMKLLK